MNSKFKSVSEQMNELNVAIEKSNSYRSFATTVHKNGMHELQNEFNNNLRWKDEFSLIDRGMLNNQLLLMYDAKKSKQEYFSVIIDFLRERTLLIAKRHPQGSMVDNFMALLKDISASRIDEMSKETATKIGVEVDEEMIAGIKDSLFDNLRLCFKAAIEIYEKHVNAITAVIASDCNDTDKYYRINNLLLNSTSSLTVEIK